MPRRSFRRSLARPLAMIVIASVTLMWGGAARAAGSGSEETTPRGDIVITSDAQFTEAHGVRSGSGTASDPYVISNWQLRNLTIKDTDAYVVIRDNDVTSRMILDWNGDRVTVAGNTVRDLRVNQNVRRTGDATSGLIAGNKFTRVGQLRHFDGIFENNVVGSPGTQLRIPGFRAAPAVAFDGFNGARFRNNLIHGSVDVKLHGHHHGSGFDDHSHHHGAHDDGMDHSMRYHRLEITGNKIYADGPWALRYYDTAHRGDDTTAASEQNEELRKPHMHHTRVFLNGNELIGAGIYVDVFNAKDRNHTGVGRGLVEIRANNITTERDMYDSLSAKDGIRVRSAQGLELRVIANQIKGVLRDAPVTEVAVADAGIRLEDLDQADVHVYRNRVTTLKFGVHARRFTESVHWWLDALETEGVEQDVHYDGSVANRPRSRDDG